MSVIIRLQNLPWSANALDIRNFFRGLSIPEGGVHIVGGELGDAFIAFSTDEDARQGMMLDRGKIKETQVRLLLSSRSEMHKVIEAARHSVPFLSVAAPVATPAPAPLAPVATVAPNTALQNVIPPPVTVNPSITPFSTALGTNPMGLGIPGIGNPQEIPQPAVIEAPPIALSPPIITTPNEPEKEEDRSDKKKEKDRRRIRSRSRSRDRKDRKRDRRDRSRSRERRRRDRSRSRDRRDRKRDRRSRSRERSPSRRSRDRRNFERKASISQEKTVPLMEQPLLSAPPQFGNMNPNIQMHQIQQIVQTSGNIQNGPNHDPSLQNRFNDSGVNDALNKLQELEKKRNPSAFQGELNGDRGKFQGGRSGANFRREGRMTRFDNIETQRGCCVAIRNAPNHTSYGDVRRFFPFIIDKHGIKMINDNSGRRTGTIFIRFSELRSKQQALQRRHNELKGAQVIVEDLDDEAYESAIDSFLPYRNDNFETEQPVVIPEVEKSLPSYNVLKVSDLPNFVKEHDIVKAFSEFSLLSILLNDNRETRTKTAYVHFVNSEDARAAFEKKERYIFGKKHTVITPCSNEDFEAEKNLQANIPDSDIVPNVVETIELPEETKGPRDPRQRRQFDNGSDSKGSPSNQVSQLPPVPTQFFPPFIPPQHSFAPQFGGPQFGSFTDSVPVDPRTVSAQFKPGQAFPSPVPDQNAPLEMMDEPLDCVLVKGLPHDSTDRTIVDLFSDTGAVPARIHLMLDTNGIPSGDCFCEFRLTQEARKAVTKHGINLEGSRVTIDLVSRSVVENALDCPKQQGSQDKNMSLETSSLQPTFFRNPTPRGGFRGSGSFRGRGGSERVPGFDRSIRGSFDNSRGNFDHGRGNFNRNRGNLDYGRGNFYQGSGYRGRGNWSDRGGRGGFDNRGGNFESRPAGYDRGRGRGFGGRGRGGFENGRDPRITVEEEIPDPGLKDFGAPGCVVSMENVPFRATVEDILNFFAEFELSQDDIIRRFNERGMPTGDARVAFRTPFDAQRAVKTRHMDMIHDRRISLAVL